MLVSTTLVPLHVPRRIEGLLRRAIASLLLVSVPAPSALLALPFPAAAASPEVAAAADKAKDRADELAALAGTPENPGPLAVQAAKAKSDCDLENAVALALVSAMIAARTGSTNTVTVEHPTKRDPDGKPLVFTVDNNRVWEWRSRAGVSMGQWRLPTVAEARAELVNTQKRRDRACTRRDAAAMAVHAIRLTLALRRLEALAAKDPARFREELNDAIAIAKLVLLAETEQGPEIVELGVGRAAVLSMVLVAGLIATLVGRNEELEKEARTKEEEIAELKRNIGRLEALRDRLVVQTPCYRATVAAKIALRMTGMEPETVIGPDGKPKDLDQDVRPLPGDDMETKENNRKRADKAVNAFLKRALADARERKPARPLPRLSTVDKLQGGAHRLRATSRDQVDIGIADVFAALADVLQRQAKSALENFIAQCLVVRLDDELLGP